MKFTTKIMALASLSLLFVMTSCFTKDKPATKSAEQTYEWKTKTSNGYEYKYVENDPSKARFYTLDNGLTVILSPSHKEPRIQTYIAIKAGSKTDPATHTGLAHYLEHMLFKGTDKFGSKDWAMEEPLLAQIEDLYEQYNSTKDEEARKTIYAQIDEVSGEAAKYAIANEYDKMMSGMGAQGTNAFTSFEQTVYTEDIPNNVIDKYLTVQGERFRNPVFRLFHTELEAVYEEKNRSLDSDGSKVFEELFLRLFPNHNYGLQTTIGTIDHLKNPSLIEIRKYFNNYYVPNNMGVVMAGDFDPDEVIKKIDEHFSYMKPGDIPEYKFEREKEITSPITADVYGPEPDRIMLGYRFPGNDSEDALMLNLIGDILTNGSAGLIDLNLVKKQKLLSAYAFSYVLQDYGMLLLGGNPAGDQSLDDVRNLLLEEIENLKKGDFSEDLITSIINNEKKDALEANEEYGSRAYSLMDNFTLDGDWLRQVTYVDWLSKVTKQDIMDFANKYFGNNYVAVYKHQGEDKSSVKVEKPNITPVVVNREDQSDFLKEVAEMPENEIKPVWLDFDKDIQKAKAGKYDVLAVKNKDNSLFELTYYMESGTWGDKLLSVASGYLEYLGTQDKSAEDISKDFYKLASSFGFRTSSRESYVYLSGLQENFEETVQMFDDLLRNCQADQEALESYIGRIKQNRENAKMNKGRIMSGLQNYALYGSDNPFNYGLTDEELENLRAEDLVEILHKVLDYNHKILYYGPESAKDIASVLEEIHPSPEEFLPLPENREFTKTTMGSNKVLMAYYDMVQAEIYWMRNSGHYDAANDATISLFNQYFGGGMESIVFQTIRESKALAYSTFAYYSNPGRADENYSFRAYVGAQADKFGDAVDGMNDLINNLPESNKALENAKRSMIKKMASQRITGEGIIFNYLSALRMGRDYDNRKAVYDKIPTMSFSDLKEFSEKEISGKPYTYCIVSGEGALNQTKLNSLGEVKVLSLEEIFGY